MKITVEHDGQELLKLEMRAEGDWSVVHSTPTDDRILSLEGALDKVKLAVWDEMIRRLRASLPRKF